MKTSFTPGPWSPLAPVDSNGHWLIHRRDSGYKSLVARVCCSDALGHGGSEEANAKLISAAPDLLAALEDVTTRMEEIQGTNRPGHDWFIDKARAAILKATA